MKNAWRSSWAQATLIMVLTVVAYLPALRGGFIWDDGPLITENSMVSASDGLYRFWFTAEAPDYYPLTWSLWWLEWRLWGHHALGYHAVNILLHAVNSVLVWKILQRLKIPAAWLAGAVFAVHPVNVATAAWISEQKNTLSMFFYAVAILLYLRFDEEERLPRSGRGWCWYGLSLAAFLLALLSKTAVVMLPVVLLGCVWWMHGRVRRKDLLGSVRFFVLAVGLGLLTVWFQYNRSLEGRTILTGGFAERLAAAGWVPWFYLFKALVPIDLTVIYPKWEVDASRWASYLPGAVLLTAFIVFWWKRKTWGRPLLFGLGYFVVMLFPVLGFFDQGFYRYSLVADHWQYYSIIGVIALVVTAGEIMGGRMGHRSNQIRLLASATLLVILAVATGKRNWVYADAESLWRDNVTKNTEAWAAHNNLGAALQTRGELGEAIAHYEQALRIYPQLADEGYNLGVALQQAGPLKEAIVQYEQTLRIRPDDAETHFKLGIALKQAGALEDAIGHYEHALRIRPVDAETHFKLGVALEQSGRVQEAIGHYKQALRIKPDYAAAQSRLARQPATP